MEQPPVYVRGVNPFTVPMRSPFRYPGGKTWLVPYLRQWLWHQQPRPSRFVEPFAGGGIMGLTTAFEELAEHVTMVELDDQVAAVWGALLWEPGYGEELAERIMAFNLSRDSVQEALMEPDGLLVDRAFRTILKNRVNRSGIIAPRASLLNAGENGKGVLSRWYPETLRQRILDIVSIRDRVTFFHGDGIEIMRNMADDHNTIFFIDPPYTVAGRRLYTHGEIDHNLLFSVAESLNGDFLMTYDNDDQIRNLAEGQEFEYRTVVMRTAHHTEKTELLIGRDLSWLE